MTTRWSCLTVVALSVGVVTAQQAPRAFEVVSIRRSTNPDTDWSSGARPGGRWVLINGGILRIIRLAYPAESSEYVGGPEWLRSERYDVTAVGPPGTTRADLEPMLRTLLTERFNFKGHYETPDRPVYDLVLARGDGKLPPGLRRIDIDCEARRDASVRGEKPPETPRPANGAAPCSIQMSYADGARIRSGGQTMAEFGQVLSGLAGRVVRERTGLAGYYEFDMRFTTNPQTDGNDPALFTALQEQLGLKLESARGPVRVFVIDQIERPTEN